jgi:hypothetical protein
VSGFFLCVAIYAANGGWLRAAPVGARSRATGAARLKTIFSASDASSRLHR